MQLIEFETRLVKDKNNDRYPYAFKIYAKVSLSFQDVKDIELIKTQLTSEFLESVNWEEGTAFFEPFVTNEFKHRFRKEETINAYYRCCEELNGIFEKYLEYTHNVDKRESSLNIYYWNEDCIRREVLALMESLESRNKSIRDCVDSLSSEECELLGIKDIYSDFKENELLDFINKEKGSQCTDGEVIASLESAYSQGID